MCIFQYLKSCFTKVKELFNQSKIKEKSIKTSIPLPINLKQKKTYSDNLNEISKEELFDGLLGHGLFAEKIPPFLSSESFLDFCKNPPNNFIFDNFAKGYIQYDSMRNINIPRCLSIPNPFAYRNQCHLLSDNWDKLQNYFKEKTLNNKHKISRIHLRKIDNSAKIFQTCYGDLEDINLADYPSLIVNHLFEMNHKNFCTDDYPEPELLIGKKYIVQADISNCFPSIYSHAIPWALVSKEISKKYKKDDLKWFNQIDVKTRNMKEAETHGVLIGPHTSNLISEIILVAVDNTLATKYDYIRNVDDYTCYLETKENTDQFLVDLSYELKKYNLTLNHKKTKILELPQAATEHWIRKINTFTFPEEGIKLKLTHIRAFLDIALELMSENKNNSSVLNYAIKILSNREMTKNGKTYFINTIHHLVLIYPYLVTLLDKDVFEKFNISNSEIKLISENIFKFAKEKKLYEAMSYSLYFSLKYDFKLEDGLFDIINSNNDCILMLLAYLHDKKYINHSAVNKKYRDLAKSLQDEIDEYWLFVYEVLTEGNLKKDEWKKIKKAKISFIQQDFQ